MPTCSMRVRFVKNQLPCPPLSLDNLKRTSSGQHLACEARDDVDTMTRMRILIAYGHAARLGPSQSMSSQKRINL